MFLELIHPTDITYLLYNVVKLKECKWSGELATAGCQDCCPHYSHLLKECW